MRLLLDAHLSGARVGEPLRRLGHDVLALAERTDLDGLDDPDVLAFAAAERRILVTRNARDFAPILREWAELGRTHHGCVLIWTLEHGAFAAIVQGVDRLLSAHPEGEDWIDRVLAI